MKWNSAISCLEYDGVLYVRETAPYGQQIGLQAVMQKVVRTLPSRTMNVHVNFTDYSGKPLKRVYQIRDGLYAPMGRQVTNWRDSSGKKVELV